MAEHIKKLIPEGVLRPGENPKEAESPRQSRTTLLSKRGGDQAR
jgi:hypothetical protein